ncbi:hypothetical protein SNOG_11313 [Parastagonospora nodorum SN15]|uniref:Uncharacterized protein n=1 Tax=Phaeosphaeria nodorum (strain SN15 / ATCC MYA-4574 / FGSC 10173) TaxID=321614 RepID=Q0UAA1_PHANO|nr:hypothetical protein SNOG_11313 [Parastagonospora nodorum SN15]EAT81021.1 hypothetical protein SNOG_11313 [Parastagonospora nodorum SN15]
MGLRSMEPHLSTHVPYGYRIWYAGNTLAYNAIAREAD